MNRGIQIVHHKETLKAVEGIAAKTEYILPRCAISKRLLYEKQIKTLHLSRLLSLEMVRGARKK